MKTASRDQFSLKKFGCDGEESDRAVPAEEYGVFILFYLIYLFFKINLFIYLFLAALVLCCCAWLSLFAASGSYSSLRRVGFSLRWLLLLQSTGSRHVGFSSCGMWAQ